MDSHSQPLQEANPHIQELAYWVAQQQAMLEQLLVAQDAQTSAASPTLDLHDLPTRPRYEWQPSPQLCELLPTLEHGIFGSPLSDDDRKAIIDRYPPVAGLDYSPPAMLPEADRHFKTGHRREDASLRSLQYAISAILHPLDVVSHSLVPLLPHDQVVRIFAMLNDIRTLVLNAGGAANRARNNLALRAVNPSFSLPSTDRTFTMALDQFKETVSTHTAMQKALKEARPASVRPTATGQFFRGVPPLGGGGQPVSNFRHNQQANQRGRHHQGPRSHGRPPNSNNPFRNQAPPPGPSH